MKNKEHPVTWEQIGRFFRRVFIAFLIFLPLFAAYEMGESQVVHDGPCKQGARFSMTGTSSKAENGYFCTVGGDYKFLVEP